MYAQQLVIEAIVVAIVFTLIGLAVWQLPCRDPAMKTARNLAITAVLAHLLFEAMGLNAYYCRHGAACMGEGEGKDKGKGKGKGKGEKCE